MRELLVVQGAGDQSAHDVISVFPDPGGHVVVTHRSLTGRDDSIARPAAAVIPLFWRFTTEKWGIGPLRLRDGQS